MALIATRLFQRRSLRMTPATAGKSESELARAARLATLGELSASIAHEVNQPLGAILSNTDAAQLLLAQRPLPVEELRRIVARIRADNLRAHEVIRRLRTLMERHEVEFNPVDVHDVLDDAIQLLAGEAKQRRVEFECRSAPGCAIVLGDKVQLQQVMLNLMVNAMDAMRCTPVPLRKVEVVARAGDSDIEVQISDRGHGLGELDPETLFKSFFTTKEGGMGLGLSIARSILLAHQGSIAAAPRPGGGAVFSVRLPASGSADSDNSGMCS
ncbi:ATP-binding protein [Aquabacterium sp. A7-Y]|uniref:sensor histidine kinase n=1 Tax=Aquabacterium sp. A7-Y TaxID=1349605 RepID=UPI00223D28D1|nr:ATP-binding protein [Aquabacterium sp. A7-Y]MCW7538552.1 ATP-binding protein [Aquabacterium sp. A7-Y]